MRKFVLQLAGITAFALGLIWFSGEGEAVQSSREVVLSQYIAADQTKPSDTIHIKIGEETAKDADTDPADSREELYQQIRKLNTAIFDIRNRYMDEIDVKDIVDAGIRGMLQNLDRYSVLMERESYDNLMENTSGRYQGVGMQIDSRNDHIVIISPLEGGPAEKLGLRAGDIIMEIEGQSTEGMKTSDASGLMRGEAGTPVKVKIKREGLPEMMEFNIVRDFITLHSVNYAGRVPGTDYGYVRLSTFSSNTRSELRQGIAEIEKQNLKGMILDLRSNGGGLLDQAVATAEMFVPKGSMIVYTQGQDPASRVEHFSRQDPIYPDKPLIVLVDEGTASASEIVAGAIQDLDRGLVLGRTTFGKGLVQQVLDLENDPNQHLKLTTARYYVPSGRCIQREDRQAKGSMISFDEEAPEEYDTLKLEDREIFHTLNGREVYGGGGIVPDVESVRDYWDPITINLRRQSMFFEFATKYIADHPETKEDIEITDPILDDFKKFVDEKGFEYTTTLQAALDEFKKTVSEEKRDELFTKQITEMQKIVDSDKADDFKESHDDIKLALKREFSGHVGGEKARYEQFFLPTDATIQQAINILKNSAEYSRLLTEGAKRAAIENSKDDSKSKQ